LREIFCRPISEFRLRYCAVKRVLGALLLLTATISMTGLAGDSGSATVGPIDRNAASRLATSLANENAKQLYDAAPFTVSQGTLRLIHGRWEWEEMAGYCKGDLVASVSIPRNGSKATPKVTLQFLTDVL
jgi:hypothetical protein